VGDAGVEAQKIDTLKELYKQAFWVYTIIVSLAVREVLVRIVPRLLRA